jgi:hypothetical protein
MHIKGFLPIVVMLPALAAGCQAKPAGQDAAPGSAAAPAAGTTAPAATATATAPPAATPAMPAAAPPSASAPAPSTAAPAAPAPVATAATPGAGATPAPAAAIASQASNWPGIMVAVTEFRRKGSTLTARVVLRNQGSAAVEPDIHYAEVYLMDLGAGKKYEVLKDEKGAYIAALRTGYDNRWYQKLAPGETYTLWMKFPAPPAEVKSVTLQIPSVPPFEDLPIQDS